MPQPTAAAASTDPSALEERVRQAFATGARVDVRPRARPSDELRHGASWGPARRVRAEFLVDLLAGGKTPTAGGVPALRLAGVAVVGELRLEAAEVPYLVELTQCWFSHRPDLRMARLSGLRLPGCRLPGLRGRNLRVGSDLVFEAGFTADGRVDLTDAHVEGSLRMSGAVLRRGGGAALLAERMIIAGALQAGVLRATGAVRLPNSRVGGNVDFGGARLSNPSGDALNAAGIEVSGDLTGEVEGGRLVRLHGAGLDVLFADRLRVGGTLFMRAIEVTGCIRLRNADIGSTLDCTGARLSAPRRRPDGSPKPSLDARVAAIGKDLLCSRGFLATGGVRIRNVEVGKSANFEGATLGGEPGAVALNAFGLNTQELNVRFAAPAAGDVLFARARTVSVFDSEQLWHTTGRVDLEGLSYHALAAEPDADVRTRLAWLHRVLPDYDPDPYERLAAMYTSGGRDESSRHVLLVKQRRRHAAMRLPGRVFGWVQEVTVGYSYRPLLALLWFLAAWAFGAYWFSEH